MMYDDPPDPVTDSTPATAARCRRCGAHVGGTYTRRRCLVCGKRRRGQSWLGKRIVEWGLRDGT